MYDEWVVLDHDLAGISLPQTAEARRLLPQHAWLDGTVLVVERAGVVQRCDIATASSISLRYRHLGAFLVLRVQPAAGAPAVDLAVEFRRALLLVSPGALRLLAHVIEARHSRLSGLDAHYLRYLADREDRRNTPVDWGFRTDPRGLREAAEIQDDSSG